MHNWWLATLEHLGLLTREQAEYIASEIKTTIHRDKYTEAYDELKYILEGSQAFKSTVASDLKAEIATIKAEVAGLKKLANKK